VHREKRDCGDSDQPVSEAREGARPLGAEIVKPERSKAEDDERTGDGNAAPEVAPDRPAKLDVDRDQRSGDDQHCVGCDAVKDQHQVLGGVMLRPELALDAHPTVED